MPLKDTEARKAYAKAYAETRRQELNAYRRAWKAANKEKMAEYEKKYKEKKGEALVIAQRARVAKWRERNLETVRAANKEQAAKKRAENPEKIKAAKKDERDYNFNMAKATELFEQGESERAIKIQTLAQAKQAKVAELGLSALKNEIEGLTAKDAAKFRQDSLALQKMQLNKPDSSVALLNALKDPANMAIYQQMNTLKKPDMISKETALKEYNDNMHDKTKLLFNELFPKNNEIII
jgi:hypothetical protein